MVAAIASTECYIEMATTQPIFYQIDKERSSRLPISRRNTTRFVNIRVKIRGKQYNVMVQRGKTRGITKLYACKKIAGDAYFRKDVTVLCAAVNKMMEFAPMDNTEESGKYWALIASYLQELQEMYAESIAA